MEHRKHVDLVSAIVLVFLSVYIIAESLTIYRDAGEIIYLSPGFMPLLMGCALLLGSIILAVRSIKGTKIAQLVADLAEGTKAMLKSPTTLKAVVGLAIMAFYVFVLLSKLQFPSHYQYLHFPIVTFVFLVALMLWMKAATLLKSSIISLCTVIGIYILFTVIFGVALP